MPSGNVFDLVDVVVAEKVKAMQSFTAYDITKTVRQRTKELFQHADVREYVHKEMTTHINTLRYIVENDKDYPALRYKPISSPTKVDTNCSTASKVSTPTLNKTKTVLNRDVENRVCVPKNFVDKILSYHPNHDFIEVCTEGNRPCCRVSYARPAIAKSGYKYVAKYAVDKSGNIRISNNTLEKLGFAKTDKIVANLINGRIFLDKQ